ncbi:MAG: hypothetical protein AAGJ35_06150, partial [Myxococcota bacterium]
PMYREGLNALARGILNRNPSDRKSHSVMELEKRPRSTYIRFLLTRSALKKTPKAGQPDLRSSLPLQGRFVDNKSSK